MGKGKTELPATPKYFEDPNFNKGVDESMGLGGRLTNFDFSGNLSPLQDTININPDVVSGFFQSLQPYYNQTRRSTMNEGDTACGSVALIAGDSFQVLPLLPWAQASC